MELNQFPKKSEGKLAGKIGLVENQSKEWVRVMDFFKQARDGLIIKDKVENIAKRLNPPLYMAIRRCLNEGALPMSFSRHLHPDAILEKLPNVRMHETLRVSSMAKPTYSTSLADVASALSTIGVKTVLSLDMNGWNWQELSLKLGEAGIRHIANSQLVIPDFLPAGGLDPERLLDICETILESKDPVIHCGAGDGRSGLVKAALYIIFEYRKNQGCSIKRMLTDEYCSGSWEPGNHQKVYGIVAQAVAQGAKKSSARRGEGCRSLRAE
ncbi:hypothetical protein [Burkholderia ubonensis]|uniref:phosphatase domain-containing putative toxin n=1 Tax=Burkholderia ubonensis TaxID=101571 RepID=UPI0012F7A41B|nr:hypothetical protein [Burkholderia ubonensis]